MTYALPALLAFSHSLKYACSFIGACVCLGVGEGVCVCEIERVHVYFCVCEGMYVSIDTPAQCTRTAHIVWQQYTNAVMYTQYIYLIYTHKTACMHITQYTYYTRAMHELYTSFIHTIYILNSYIMQAL